MFDCKHLLNIIGGLLLCCALSSCDTSDRKGVYETTVQTTMACLEERGEFSSFLKAVDICGYSRLIDGGGLVTVFAPADDAFQEWIDENYPGSSLEDIPVEELSLVVGFHLIQFAYDPDDFLAFTTVSSETEEVTGDGACYKYKTYSREPVKLFKDPLSAREVHLFSREKYMPVFSTRLFKSRGIQNPEADYRRLFPDVNWMGSDERLYAGPAAVTEMGIQTCNGYVYVIDKVLEPAPTIYEWLCKEENSEYSVIRKLFDRIRHYEYDAAVTKNYSVTSDSLFYFYHWKTPSRTAEIPEIASEWTYHNESGVVFDRALRYCNNCFFPKDEVLEPFLKEYFKEYGTYEREDYISVIPKNAIYHLLRAHMYGLQDIILPSELDMLPVNGINGEKFQVSSSEVDVHYCSNGVVYGMNKIFVPAVFGNMTEIMLKDPDYSFYSRAFNVKNMYQQAVDRNNQFTLFIQSDADLAVAGYSSGETVGVNGVYTFKKKDGNMAETAVGDLMMSQFVFGRIPSPGEIDMQRYFVSKDNKTYFYVKENTFYDATDKPVTLLEEIDADNGVIYRTDRVIPARVGGFAETCKKQEFTKFRNLMRKAELANNDAVLQNSMAGLKDALVFFPTNEAVDAAREQGMLPDETDLEALSKYLKYYFVPLKKNKLENFLLPGLGPEGMTVQAYSRECSTLSDYVSESDMKTMTVSWDPANSTYLTLTDMSGNSLTTVPERVELHHNCACYAIEQCFDYRTMFGNQ